MKPLLWIVSGLLTRGAATLGATLLLTSGKQADRNTGFDGAPGCRSFACEAALEAR